jgi:hypothetical protein
MGDNMANSHNLLQLFDGRIALPPATKKALRASRDTLREKVRAKFSTKGYSVKFHSQGSVPMGTVISPSDGDYDIDDGIYIEGDQLPTDAIPTLHSWIVEAAEGHTKRPPTDKNTCVRVHFSDGHHVDLVLYSLMTKPHPLLAHKKEGWTASDPREFTEWFDSRAAQSPQLRNLVRYLKAWADHLRGDMPSGLVMTILGANSLVPNARDDVALAESLALIRQTLNASFACYRPTTPQADLFRDYPATRKSYFLERLASFVTSATQALEVPNQKDACPKWSKHLGPRFPCELAEDTIGDAKKYESPAVIRGDARSA